MGQNVLQRVVRQRRAAGAAGPARVLRLDRGGLLRAQFSSHRPRGDERIRLQHIRTGGRVFTTAQWVAEFGAALAKSDAEHFARKDRAGAAVPPRPSSFAPQSRPAGARSQPQRSHRRDTAIDAELDAEGL